MSLVKMRSFIGALIQYDCYFFKKVSRPTQREETQREEDHIEMEAEIGVKLLPGKEDQGWPETGAKAWSILSLGDLRRNWPCQSLTLNFWSPTVGKNKFLLF